MDQIMRILTLLRELPIGTGTPPSSAPVLAQLLGTSERTIYRDVRALQDAGFVVCNDGQGYFLAPTDGRVPHHFTAQEVVSLLYVAQWAQQVLPDSMKGDHLAAVAKLVASLGSQEARHAALDGVGGLSIQPSTTDGPTAQRHLVTALLARQLGRKLRGAYYSPDRDSEGVRTIHPYALIYRGHAHYLTGFCEARRSKRTFRLDRFRDLEMLDAPAQVPEDYRPDADFAGAWEVTGGRRVRVSVRVIGETARRLRGTRLHPSQVLLPCPPEELVLEFRVAVTDELVTWLLGLGSGATVLAPRSLAQRVRETALGIAANYAAD
jgi:predicted DNA-binding transcriptional regulator YafY